MTMMMKNDADNENDVDDDDEKYGNEMELNDIHTYVYCRSSLLIWNVVWECVWTEMSCEAMREMRME